MAYGLPVEGDDGPFVGQVVTEAVTCDVGATVGEARTRLGDAGAGAAVVTHGDRLAVGEIDEETLAGADDDRRLLEVMGPVPSTVRPSVTVSSLAGAHEHRVLVTTPDGRLLGEAVIVAEPDEHDGDHTGHDHHHDDNDESSSHLRRMEDELMSTMEAVAKHFGDREPSDAELRSYLRDHLVDEGRSPEEADRFMAELDDPEHE
jgi:CBS domain-containing protein